MPVDTQPGGFDGERQPQWNAQTFQLLFRGSVVKQFRTLAPNQERILSAFQEEGWPMCIDDPLPPVPEVDAKQRLHGTIKRLNGNQLRPLLLFSGDGKGLGIYWRAREGARKKKLASRRLFADPTASQR